MTEGFPAVKTGTTVQAERHDGIAVLRMSRPPVNCLDRVLRQDLLLALEDAEYDAATIAVVLTGSAGGFSAGADLAEFDRGEALAEPSLHLAIAGWLDRMTTPVVAAIDGVALGGGLELALACHYRVATASARLGLPEITLGFMPGAGGTQRLPRAVGFADALNLILSGRRLDGVTAAGLGLVDEVSGSDIIGDALRFAATVTGRPPRRLRDVTVVDPNRVPLLAFARRQAARDPRSSPGTLSVLDALAATEQPFDTALELELELFQALSARPSAQAYRYNFLSERRAGRVAAPPDGVAEPRTAAVVGGGTMGRGISLALLGAGILVSLVERSEERRAAARSAIEAELGRGVARGRITAAQRDEQLSRLAVGTDLATAQDAELWIEAVFEDPDIKRAAFAAIESVAKPDAILASNTSSLDLNVIAEATERPERVVGLHFFSPANVMRLVEIIEGRRTSAETLAAACALAKRLGKIAVVAQVGDGFIGNRVMDAYVLQAMKLLQAGVLPDRVDRVLEAWGFAMGPFRVLDLVGNDIPWQARRARRGSSPAEAAWKLADELCERGWFGQKAGRGWYRYPGGQPVPDPEVGAMVEDWAARSGGGRQVDDLEIIERCLYAMVNESAAVLAEGVAERGSDIDVVFRHGYGFPAARGGPLFFADTVGLDAVLRTMRRFAAGERAPSWWVPHPLLVEWAAQGLRISSWGK
jgi:3-hydroxyacyl-CoA dehydrogenase